MNHPKHPSGEYWCNAEHPMPLDSPGKWIHENARDVGREPKGNNHTTIHFACPDCGFEWSDTFPNWEAVVTGRSD